MKTYQLKDEWRHVQDLESAIQMKMEEALSMAQRQGAATVKLGRIPGLIAEMFELVTVPQPAKRAARSDTQS
mgnify:CR=1 FL=1